MVISEVRVSPTPFESIEIYNPTTATITLSDYRIYNATFLSSSGDGGAPCYYYDHTTNLTCGTSFGDFDLQFPLGATIAPNQALVVALTGSANYQGSCDGGSCRPDFEIPPPAGAPMLDDPAVPNMRGTWDQNAANFSMFGFLTNGSEDAVLYSWNGTPSLVVDVDYVIWGTGLGVRTSKTGIATYAADTPVANQRPVSQTASAATSFQRVCYNEGAETATGGNGLAGHDETSEDLGATFIVGPPSPGAKTPGSVP